MTKLDSHETKTAFAARVGLTKGRISQLVAEGLPVRADGRIDVAVGLAWIEDNLDPARRNRGGATVPTRATTTLAEAKRLHEIVKVQRAKLAFEREQGQLVETAAATRTVFARARAERDAHMAWVQRTAPLLAAELGADPRATFAALDRMMREHLEHLGGIASGNALIVGSIFGIAAYSSAEGDPVEISTTGVFHLPKASAAVLTVGARVAWDNTAKAVTTPAAGRFPIGVAVEAAGNGVTSVAVRLDGVATAAA